MSTHQIVIAGFGGQGVLFAGKLLAYAGMMMGKEVSWLPSYGPEMRGGTANCHVILSDDMIASPIIQQPDILMALNKPSLEKFIDTVNPGGYAIYDNSLIEQPPVKDGVNLVGIPATKLATDIGAPKMANMVVLGQLIKASGVMTLDELKTGMAKSIPASKQHLLESNNKILDMGYQFER